MKKIAVLAGDGIGPGEMAEATKVLDTAQKKFSADFLNQRMWAGSSSKTKVVGTAAMGEAIACEL